MSILFFHLFYTFCSVILGYYLFLFSKKPMEQTKNLVYLLCALLVSSAISGIMLNTYSFSPFHVLAIVTITTIPLVLWNLFRSNFLQSKKGLLYNFIGLNLAMIGAFEPDRYIGRRLHLTIEIWAVLMILATIFSVYIIIQANRKSNFSNNYVRNLTQNHPRNW
jgi:uncharacterized membrane protein